MLDVGDPAPPFAVPDQSGRTVTLDGLRGRWVLLYWYPKADTPGCTAQAQGLRDQHEALDALGCTVLGASFDPPADLVAFRRKYDLPFDLLSDAESEAGRAYGVAGDEGSGRYAARVAFLIDPSGAVARRYDVEAPEMFADEVLDDLEEARGR